MSSSDSRRTSEPEGPDAGWRACRVRRCWRRSRRDGSAAYTARRSPGRRRLRGACRLAPLAPLPLRSWMLPGIALFVGVAVPILTAAVLLWGRERRARSAVNDLVD